MRLIRLAVFSVLSLASASLFMLAFAPTAAQGTPSEDGVWQTVNEGQSAGTNAPATAASAPVLRLNKEALAGLLARAPREGVAASLRSSVAVVSLPMPDGSFLSLRIEESPVLDAALVAQYPEIKSYRGQGIEDASVTARFDWTPLGLHAFVLTGDGAVSVRPANANDTATYTSAYAESNGFLTLLSDGQRLTGAYALGPEAGEWLQQATLAIRARVPLDVVADTIQPFPTFSEIYHAAVKALRREIVTAREPAAAGATPSEQP